MRAVMWLAVGLFVALNLTAEAHGQADPQVVRAHTTVQFYSGGGMIRGTEHIYLGETRFTTTGRGGLTEVVFRAVEPKEETINNQVIRTFPDTNEVAKFTYTSTSTPSLAAISGDQRLKCTQGFSGENRNPVKGWVQVRVKYADGTQLVSPFVQPVFYP